MYTELHGVQIQSDPVVKDGTEIELLAVMHVFMIVQSRAKREDVFLQLSDLLEGIGKEMSGLQDDQSRSVWVSQWQSKVLYKIHSILQENQEKLRLMGYKRIEMLDLNKLFIAEGNNHTPINCMYLFGV